MSARSGRLRRSVRLLGPLLLLFARPAAGDATGPIRLDVLARGAGCPSPAALASALSAASRRFVIALDAAPADAAPVAVFDEGPVYRVLAGTVVRAYKDPGRRCDERARTAAVLVALTLDPPPVAMPHRDDADLERILADPAPPAAPPPPAPACPPVAAAPIAAVAVAAPIAAPAPPPRRSWITLAAAGLAEGAPGAGAGSATGGGRMELAMAWRGIGAAVGLSGTAASDLAPSGVRARLARVAVDANLLGAIRRGLVEGVGELGLALSLDAVQDPGAPRSGWSLRAEPAARLAAGVRLWLATDVALTASAHGLLSLRPVPFQTPSGEALGQTPRAWLGGSIGVAFRMR